MVNSSRYIALKKLESEFSLKMRYTGNPQDLQTEANILDWIRLNISNTGFINYTDALDKWNRIKSENYLVYVENQTLFTLIAAEPKGSKALFNLLIGQVPPVVVPNNSCTCLGDYLDNVATFTSSYQNSVQALANQAGEMSPSELGVEFNTLKLGFQLSLDAALDQYNHCIDDCE
ncbi:hypothetical protein CHU92_00490 [Flavobacterium cyanobacteriorum]|uniref:Uncharacterized protein n=2 Tax=Flavobacterium cyanobacteriorum TaxID=2022802 RepID=A0A256A5L3_9FLAO|nr:hypothetical protein CHU92_00490 [Flavobacterium cyanobacteriorum]